MTDELNNNYLLVYGWETTQRYIQVRRDELDKLTEAFKKFTERLNDKE